MIRNTLVATCHLRTGTMALVAKEHAIFDVVGNSISRGFHGATKKGSTCYYNAARAYAVDDWATN